MWYAIQVQAKRELAVVEKCRERNLLLPGEDIFTILSERMVKERGEWKKKTEVAFQKYIIAETGDTDGFRIRLRNVGGVGDEANPRPLGGRLGMPAGG